MTRSKAGDKTLGKERQIFLTRNSNTINAMNLMYTHEKENTARTIRIVGE